MNNKMFYEARGINTQKTSNTIYGLYLFGSLFQSGETSE